ncbi:MAG: FitA-like ribbon-helix-helix domain-containing protein [Actinomycetota bacterium]
MPDVNVRNVPEAVARRLREQADLEGVSFSEWVRITLADRAELPTASEIARRRARRGASAQSGEEFAAFYRKRLRRRSA